MMGVARGLLGANWGFDWPPEAAYRASRSKLCFFPVALVLFVLVGEEGKANGLANWPWPWPCATTRLPPLGDWTMVTDPGLLRVANIENSSNSSTLELKQCQQD